MSLALLLLLLYPVWSIMLRPDLDLWRTDDGEAHLLRIYAMRLAFNEVFALPRWASDLYRGYGYPVFNFYAPLSYYGATLLTALGLSTWDAFRALGIVTIASGATGTYALVRSTSSRITGNRDRIPAIAAGMLYVFAPYPFITNLYSRADLPEALGMGILPWFLLAVDRCLMADGSGSTLRTILVAAVVGAALLLTHQLSAVLGIVSASIWIGVHLVNKPFPSVRRGILRLVTSGVIAGGLVAFSAIPTLTEGASVQLGLVKAPIDDMLERLAVPFGSDAPQLRSHPTNNPGLPGAVDWTWTYRYPWGLPLMFSPVKPSAALAVTALSASAGIIVITLARMFASRTRRRTIPGTPASALPPAVPIMGPVLILGVMWMFNTTWTAFVWANFAPMQFLQIPARLYGPFSLGVALALGMLLDRLAVRSVAWRRAGWVVAVASVMSVAIGSLADAPIPFLEGVSHAVDANALLRTEFNRDAWNGGAATGSGEFTPVGVDIAVAIPGRPRGNQVFDRDYPPGSWVGSTALVYAGSARITELRRDVLRNEVGVEVESSGATVAFHQLWFPGWRAFIDGAEVSIRVPPYDASEDSRLGFQLVDVPAGYHTVTTVFGSTLPRMTGDAITALTAIAVTIAMLMNLGRGWPTIVSWSRAGWIVASVASLGFAGMAIAQTVFEVSMSQPPSVPGTTPNLIIADVADLVRNGRTRISSPTGSALGADKFIDVRWLLVGAFDASRPNRVEFPHGGRQRQWLFMHPESRVAFDVTVPETATYFTAGMALRTEAWYTDYGDGVRFSVDIASDGHEASPAYAIRLNPRANEDERQWIDVRIPLGGYVGRQIEITLRTDPVDDVRNDWAGWGNPMVVIDRTLLRPVNGPIVPASVGTRPTFPG